MPKNESSEVMCVNHHDSIMTLLPEMGVMHLQKKPESSDEFKGGNFNFDVYVCQECDYVEMYGRKYNPDDDNNITPITTKFEW